MECAVCCKDVGGAHSCARCDKKVHLICGQQIGDEGYGQSIICYNCEKQNEDGEEIESEYFQVFLRFYLILWGLLNKVIGLT